MINEEIKTLLMAPLKFWMFKEEYDELTLIKYSIVLYISNKQTKRYDLVCFKGTGDSIQRIDDEFFETYLIMYTLLCSEEKKDKLIAKLTATEEDETLKSYKTYLLKQLESPYRFTNIGLIVHFIFAVIFYIPTLVGIMVYNAITREQKNTNSLDNHHSNDGIELSPFLSRS